MANSPVLHLHLLVLVPYFATNSASFARICELSPIIIRSSKSFPSSLYWIRRLNVVPIWFFGVLPWVVEVPSTKKLFTSWSIVMHDLCEKHAAISRHISIIVRCQSLRRVCTHHTVLLNVMLVVLHACCAHSFSLLRTSTAIAECF